MKPAKIFNIKKDNTVCGCGPKIDMWPRNMPLLKNPQFLPNFFEQKSLRPTVIWLISTLALNI